VARRDDDQDQSPEAEDANLPPEEEADGYRPSRRQAKKEAPKKEAAPKPETQKPVNQVDAFMEQHWEAWLRPVVLLAVLAVGVLGYKWELIPEHIIGLCAVGGIVLVTIYAVASPVLDLLERKRDRVLFGVLVAAWAFSSGMPALRKTVARPTLAEAVLTEAQKTAKVTVAGGKTGPFDMTVSGKIQASGQQQATATYELNITATGGASQNVEGELEYSVHQGRVRRGTTHWTEKHDQVVHRLPSGLRGSELTLSTERIDDLLQDGLHIRLHPQDGLLPLLLPKIGGVEVPVLGILVVLVMIFLETKVGDAKNKPYLVMASLVTLVFSWRFSQRATANNLVPPAVEALFVALITGGLGGTALGWVARRVSGRSKLRPAKADDKDRKGRDED
jgi:hypothetical protein